MLSARHRRNWALLLAPQELAGRSEGAIFTAICVVAIGLITAADFLTPRYGTIGAVDMVPVAAAAWLLSRRLVVLVVLVAMAAGGLEAAVGITPPLTAAARIVVVPLLAVLARLAATSVVERDNSERLARDARELERAKSDFLRLASHELRGPVAILRGYLSMLEDGSLGHTAPAVQEVVSLLSASANGMNAVVDEMLDVARLEDSRLQLNVTRTDLVDLVRRSAATVERIHAGSHRVAVTAERLPMMELDRGRVTTIVGNLVSNAIKYSPAGSDVLVAVEAGDGEARVAVKDRGIGLTDEQKANLFTRFGRVVRPETQNISGTGLGLYLSRELARLHKGDITVESAPGKGSTFTLKLPLPAVRRADTAPAPTARRARAQQRRRRLAG